MTFNDRSSIMTLLATRRSAKAREMVAPGPDRDQLHQILAVGMRVPDHGKLAPWRFVIVDKDRQAALGERFAAAYAAEKPDPSKLELEAMRAFPAQAPMMVAVLSRLNTDRAIPAWEQQLSAGAACQTMLIAATGLGFAGCWLTGWAAYSEAVIGVLGGAPGDRVAGFLFFGTPGRDLAERARPDFDDIVSHWRG